MKRKEWGRGLGAWVKRNGSRLRSKALRWDVQRLLSFGYVSQYPQRQLVVGYIAYTVIGLLLLMLPFSVNRPIPVIDQLFTAVSALSTTGLSTVDVAGDYTFWGQLVILLLIQAGGLGYMTFSSYVMFGLTHHLGRSKSRLFNSQFSFPGALKSGALVRNIIHFAFGFEVAGILLLYPYFLFHDVADPLWSAVFHSISAFCTAGFSIWTDNLVRFQTDYYVNIVILLLSYMGAMGFIVMTDLWYKVTRRHHRITFTSKVIIGITFLLSLWSTLHLYFREPSLAVFAPGDRLMISLFQSVSAMTTVGFNTVEIGLMAPLSLLILTLAMYIGASPSGTGGGLKSTTLSAIYAYTKNKLGLHKDISLFGNIIPSYRVETAVTACLFYTFLFFAGIYFIVLFEAGRTGFLKIVFEVSSALATAGLSSGILPVLTAGSKVVLILLMFIGRVGVVTIGNVLLVRSAARRSVHVDDLVV